MRTLRLVLSAVFTLTVLPITLVAAQSNSGARADQPQAADARYLPSLAAGQRAPDGGKRAVKFGKPVIYNSGSMPRSVAMADVNGDGRLDLVTADESSDSVSVLLGNGDGTFQAPVSYGSGGYQPDSVAIADLNGDGRPDLIVANFCQSSSNCDGEVSVLFGNGDGTFQAAVAYSSGGYEAVSVAVADFNGDGKPDLVAGNCSSAAGTRCNNAGTVGVLLGKGHGGFRPAVSYDAGGFDVTSVAIGDMNSDGHPDVVVAGCVESGGSCYYPSVGVVSVLLGMGDGSFQPAVDNNPGRQADFIAVADLNGDGHPDVVTANGWTVVVLLGNGDGTLLVDGNYNQGGAGSPSIVIADVNGDGLPDLVVSNPCWNPQVCTVGEVGVMVGNGDGSFNSAVRYTTGGTFTASVAVGDWNGDGRPDIAVANSRSDTVGVFLNAFVATTTTKIAASPNPGQVGQPVTFTATVTSISSVPNGAIITFYNGTTQIGTGTTTAGVASFTTSFSKAKTYSIKAKYPGDVFHKASSGGVKQVVTQ